MEKLGPKAEKAIPELMEMLVDEEFRTRLNAPYALGRIGSKAIPRLLDGLKSDNPLLRKGSAWHSAQ